METPAPPLEKRSFTVDEFMAAYGIRRTKLYEEIGSGRLAARRAGARTLITREAADAWLASLPPYGQDSATRPNPRRRALQAA